MNNQNGGTNRHPEARQNARQVQRRPVNSGSAPVNHPSGQRRPPVQNAGRPAPQRPVQRQQNVQHKPQPAKAAPSKNARPNALVNAKRTPPKKVQQKPVKASKGLIGLLVGAAVILVLVVLAAVVINFYQKETALLKNEVTIEAGTVRPDINMYFDGELTFPDLMKCNLNFDEVNINLPQTVNFNINIYGLNYPCKLYIVDTIPPTGEGVAQEMFAGQELPDALSCITNINDVTDVSAYWKDVPDLSYGGNFFLNAFLVDAAGNETPVTVPFKVTKDSTPPEIKGALDLEVYIGDSVTYLSTLIVTDDYDPEPVVTVDNSAVNVEEEGVYEVIYTATDFSGNSTSVSVDLTVKEKPEGYIEPEEVYELAREILDEITEPGMSEEEIALQIVWWCRYNIKFILKTNSDSWTEAAYNAFINRTGNCYSTVYAVKVLLDVAGIENMIIERWPYETATHFWNYVKLNGQWYHCDATWREGYDSYFFMYTTKELQNFWQGGWNGFQYRVDDYPESATESVQSRIDYRNHTIKEQ